MLRLMDLFTSRVWNFYSEEVTVCFPLLSTGWLSGPAVLHPDCLCLCLCVWMSTMTWRRLVWWSPCWHPVPTYPPRPAPFLRPLVYHFSLEPPSLSKLSPWLAWCSMRPEWRTAALTTPSSTTCTRWSTVWSLSWAWSPTVPPSLCSASGWRWVTRPPCLWLI